MSLTLITMMPDLILTLSYSYRDQTYDANGTTPPPPPPPPPAECSLTAQPPSDVSPYQDASPYIIIIHSVMAIGIFFVAWGMHSRIRPYEYPFQNWIETGLYVVDILVVNVDDSSN